MKCSCTAQVQAERAAQQDVGAQSTVNGMDFARLVQRKPQLEQELLLLRDVLLEAASEDTTLKARHQAYPVLCLC